MFTRCCLLHCWCCCCLCSHRLCRNAGVGALIASTGSDCGISGLCQCILDILYHHCVIEAFLLITMLAETLNLMLTHPGTCCMYECQNHLIYIMQDISNTLWALATLNITPSAELAQCFLTATQLCFDSFKPQEVSNTFWALATLLITPDAAWYHEMLCKASKHIHGYQPRHVVTVLWACAKLRMQPPAIWTSSCLRAIAPRLQDCCMQVSLRFCSVQQSY